MSITFTVYGLPQPAGSKTPRPIWRKCPDGRREMVTRENGTPILNTAEANPKAASWRQEIASVARQAMTGRAVIECPVRIDIQFIFPRPKSHFGSGKNAGVLKANAPQYHTTKPDRLKCCRALEDALKGIVYRDDSQTCAGTVTKRYGDAAATVVTIEPIN